LEDAAKMLVQAFVSCSLDCCISALYSINLCQQLRSVQNAAASLVGVQFWGKCTGCQFDAELNSCSLCSCSTHFKAWHCYMSHKCQLVPDASQWLWSLDTFTCCAVVDITVCLGKSNPLDSVCWSAKSQWILTIMCRWFWIYLWKNQKI